MNWIEEVSCPLCDEVLEVESAKSPFSEEEEIVYVCKNKYCEHFNSIVFDNGDIDNHRHEETYEDEVIEYDR